MDIIYLLIPVSVILVILIVAAFLWAIRHRQFDDLERHGRDILLDDDTVKPDREPGPPAGPR